MDLVARCEGVLRMKVMRTSRFPRSVGDQEETSLVENLPCSANENMPSPLEESNNVRPIASPGLFAESRQLDQEAKMGREADTATINVWGDSPQASELEGVKEEQRGHHPLSQLSTKWRGSPALGFSPNIVKASAECRVQKESAKEAESDRFDIVAKKMQTRKLSQPSKPLATNTHVDNSEASMSEFTKALRSASLQREARMMQNKPRFTKIVEGLLPNSEDESESPSTKRVTSALLQKIESVATRISVSPSKDEHKRYSDASGWSDADSPSPRTEKATKDDSEFEYDEMETKEGEQSRLVEGGNKDEGDHYFLTMDASTSEDSKGYVIIL